MQADVPPKAYGCFRELSSKVFTPAVAPIYTEARELYPAEVLKLLPRRM
jgi:hypothetical protein